ncbi:DUF5709 domain-containing protein [Streptomyces sp. ME02-7008A-1]|uniref:DUF5709 domain-containing protein n=1 Tax=unclassified Streptomyces TaxID=2593676 RepID=UPI0029A9970E|nr:MULTISPECIES: DUF5709 domain-containing protein [unclassified Streptomyces]MDX3180413.1 DUF5709 domain-containing protein [Streptomyces sp. ME02-7008A-1]MDX3301154.1 DUF5709 domain-containing protein [Streptomyces sp. ME02-7008A]
MPDEGRGDDVYQPDGSDTDNPPTDDLDPENVIGEPDLDEMLDTGYSPPEKPLGVTKYGTTGEEQREGESLDRRLAQEVPEDDPLLTDEPHEGPEDNGPEDNGPEEDDAGTERAGRLTTTDEEPGIDRNNRTLGRDVGIDGGAASAEEAALHIQEDDEI